MLHSILSEANLLSHNNITIIYYEKVGIYSVRLKSSVVSKWEINTLGGYYLFCLWWYLPIWKLNAILEKLMTFQTMILSAGGCWESSTFSGKMWPHINWRKHPQEDAWHKYRAWVERRVGEQSWLTGLDALPKSHLTASIQLHSNLWDFSRPAMLRDYSPGDQSSTAESVTNSSIVNG